MAGQTVRVNPQTHAKLKSLADATGQSMPDILEQAVEALRRQRLLDDTNRAYAGLRKNPKAWRAELAERAEWDATLSDDLL
jgi:predicted transcriptional regulator